MSTEHWLDVPERRTLARGREGSEAVQARLGWMVLAALASAGCDGGGTTMMERPDSGPLPIPTASCTPPVMLEDTTSARVVGTGTPESCTEAALREAIPTGAVRFDCGPSPHTITVASTLEVSSDLVLDGGGLVTLSGGGSVRILRVASSYERDTPRVLVQRLTFVDGNSAGDGSEPDQGGGAIQRVGGTLAVIDSTFRDNRCPSSGQDVAGGAIMSIGGGVTTIVGSTFLDNACSNGGAIGNLGNDLVIATSVLRGNHATGTGGNPGDGGNGGAISMDGENRELAICGAIVEGNSGTAYGGAIFRVSYHLEPSTIDRSTIRNNTLPGDETGQGGGLYLQGTAIRLTSSTIAGNEARAWGGLFVGPRSSIEAVNTTFAENVALSGLGGAIGLSDEVSGNFVNVTIARNRAPGEVAFAGAITGGTVTLRNVLVIDNEAGNGWNPISCTSVQNGAGGNVQWPVMRTGGGSDDPDALCAPDVLVSDVELGALGDHGGPTPTIVPVSGSAASGIGRECPPFDQRGEPRETASCTPGAVEVER